MQIAGVDLDELEFANIGSWPLIIQVITIVLLFVITLLGGYAFDLSDQWGTLSNLRDKRIEVEKTFEIAENKVANLEAYKNQVKSVEIELEKLTRQLPQNNEEAGLLEDISQQVTASNLQFVSIKPNEEQIKEFYIENPIQLTLSGDYKGFGEFASAISNMQRIVTLHEFKIEKMSLSNTTGVSTELGEQSMKGPLVITVITKTYWAAPNKNRDIQR